MAYLLLAIAIACVIFLSRQKKANRMDNSGYSAKDWIKAGGVLGMAILLARAGRVPLATILTALPFILPHLKRAEGTQAKNGGTMTREEAALILGIAENASEEEIKSAHRALITKNHPDKGGNDYLAAKINQARDILLRK